MSELQHFLSRQEFQLAQALIMSRITTEWITMAESPLRRLGSPISFLFEELLAAATKHLQETLSTKFSVTS